MEDLEKSYNQKNFIKIYCQTCQVNGKTETLEISNFAL